MATAVDAPPRRPDDTPREPLDGSAEKLRRSYLRLAGMIVTSMVAMFVVMYLNTYQWSHVEWSQTRFYMTFVMGAVMTVVMLGFMWSMHHNRTANIAICAAAVVVFAFALWLVRSQTTIGDESYMRAMIPHHSIAILTSKNAHIDDVRVRKLADGIISSQCREISEMKWLIHDIDQHGKATTSAQGALRPVPHFAARC